MKREYIEKVRKIEISFMSYCLLALLTVLVSCEDWLDVRPKSQVKEEIFFESEDGFRDATLGIYTIMSSTSLYGGEATMAFLDVLAQQYSSVGQNYKQAMQYNYADDGCKTRFDRMWTTAYNGVANCNYILKNLQEKGRVMPDSLRRLVQGETMAARTYLLFDMIRAYAPSYKTGMDSLAVPLVREVTNSPVTPTTVSASLDVLINDLEEARELVKDIDPFSLFAIFNRNLRPENKRGFLQKFKEKFGLKSDIPEDFDGIPTVNSQRAFFFNWADKNKESIDQFWEIFEGVVLEKDISQIFDKMVNKMVSQYSLTMILYWIAPDRFLNLDGRNRSYLKTLGLQDNYPDLDYAFLEFYTHHETLCLIHHIQILNLMKIYLYISIF